MSGILNYVDIKCCNCEYVDTTPENERMCNECNDMDMFTPAKHIINMMKTPTEEERMSLLNSALGVIRQTCKDYYDEQIGCATCPLRSNNELDSCGLLGKPKHWKLKSDAEDDNRLFM